MRASRWISSTRGSSAASERNTFEAAAARNKPKPEPIRARRNVSASNCAISAPREAPREKRTEISCWRWVERDKSRATILVHAISSRSETEPKSNHSERQAQTGTDQGEEKRF